VLQLLYTFYESRTNIHILFEELLYKDTSRYVDRMRRELKRSHQEYRIGTRSSQDSPTTHNSRKEKCFDYENINNVGSEEKMQVRQFSFFILYAFNICVACLPGESVAEYISNLAGSTTIPLLINFVPGLLYYRYCLSGIEH